MDFRPRGFVGGATPLGERSSIRDRTRFGMARPCRAERVRAGAGQLHEAAHRGPHQYFHFLGHPCRLVGSVRTGAQSAGRLRLARLGLHAGGAARPEPIPCFPVEIQVRFEQPANQPFETAQAFRPDMRVERAYVEGFGRGREVPLHLDVDFNLGNVRRDFAAGLQLPSEPAQEIADEVRFVIRREARLTFWVRHWLDCDGG
jgi:hypothetical protein